ncbi:MAG: gluconate 2-dehydrogenase subunit 3 family protein [Acetobacteraceae bacterium]|nr:gluconate 2-dehydrogenase subunit 3 family protein [Acetobacteraceae bacterium]
MREIDRRTQIGRRVLLRGAATAIPAAALASAGMGISAQAIWAQSAKNLNPHTMATLVLVARDIYPHDQIADSYYVKAVQPYDEKVATDSKLREMIEQGVARLDADAQNHFKTPYIEVLSQQGRLTILQGETLVPFFNKLRSDLVVALYNQPDLWRRFGYLGSSFEYGGYINRGFNDIDWLPKV